MNIIELLDGVRHAGRQMGLTLMELIIVMAIIAILSGTAISFYFGQIEKARVIKAIAALDNLQLKITIFELNYNRLPGTLEEVGSGDLTDPWGRPYRYLNFAALEEGSEEEETLGKGKKKKGAAKGKKKKSSTEAEDVRRRDLYDKLLNSEYALYSCGKDGKSAASITGKQSDDDIVITFLSTTTVINNIRTVSLFQGIQGDIQKINPSCFSVRPSPS